MMRWAMSSISTECCGGATYRSPAPPTRSRALRAKGERVLFATNNSSEIVAAQEAKLARFGISAGGDVVTSAQAAAALVEPGARVLVCAGPGVVEAVEQREAVPLRDGPADAVIVGWHRDFDYERMRSAFLAVDAGARLIATNSDRTYPTPSDPIPGGGAIAASIAYAADVEPIVAGKPHQPMVDLVDQSAWFGGHGGRRQARDRWPLRSCSRLQVGARPHRCHLTIRPAGRSRA